jgi:thiol-disulfide isomerase/thioredoxin
MRLLLACVLVVSAVSAANAAPAVVRAPDDTLALDALRGRVVLLDFWASWCAPCRESFPWMIALQERHAGEGLVVVAVNVDKKREQAEAFLAKQRGAVCVVYDPDGRLAAQFGLKGMPATFLYDRSGVVRETRMGFKKGEAAAFERTIATLLAEPEPAAGKPRRE